MNRCWRIRSGPRVMKKFLNLASNESIRVLWFSTHGSFSNVNSKYQQTQLIVRLNFKSDSFLMRNLHNLLRSTVAVFEAIESLTNQIGTVGLNWLAETPTKIPGSLHYHGLICGSSPKWLHWMLVVSLLSPQVILMSSGTAETSIW